MEPAERIEKIKIHEFYSILKWVFSLFYKVVPYRTTALFALNIFYELDNLISIFILAKTLDVLIGVAQSPTPDLKVLYPYIAALFTYNIVARFLFTLDNYLRNSQRLIAMPEIEKIFYTRLKDLGIQTLQQPEVSNKIQRSDNTMGYLFQFGRDTTSFVASIVKLVSTAVILISIMPLITPFVLLSTIPNFLWDQTIRKKFWLLDRESTEDRRKANQSKKISSGPHVRHRRNCRDSIRRN